MSMRVNSVPLQRTLTVAGWARLACVPTPSIHPGNVLVRLTTTAAITEPLAIAPKVQLVVVLDAK